MVLNKIIKYTKMKAIHILNKRLYEATLINLRVKHNNHKY